MNHYQITHLLHLLCLVSNRFEEPLANLLNKQHRTVKEQLEQLRMKKSSLKASQETEKSKPPNEKPLQSLVLDSAQRKRLQQQMQQVISAGDVWSEEGLLCTVRTRGGTAGLCFLQGINWKQLHGSWSFIRWCSHAWFHTERQLELKCSSFLGICPHGRCYLGWLYQSKLCFHQLLYCCLRILFLIYLQFIVFSSCHHTKLCRNSEMGSSERWNHYC